MGLMNFGFGLLIYEDSQNESPKVRTPDITKEWQAVSVSKPRSEEIVLAPGESEVIAATTRNTLLDNTTEFELSRPNAQEDIIRMSWTGVGTSPGFRTRRDLSLDATSELTLTRIAPNTVRIQSSGGSPMVTTAVIQGDVLKFERNTDSYSSVFSAQNHGHYFQVQSKGIDYVDFLDNGIVALQAGIILGVDFDNHVRVFSQGPVRLNDTVQLAANGINSGNVGKFKIIDLSSDYVEFVNAFGVSETFINTDNVAIYDRLVGFLVVRGNGGRFKLKLNNQADAFQVGLIQRNESLFAGSIEAHTVEAINDTNAVITLSIQQASLC